MASRVAYDAALTRTSLRRDPRVLVVVPTLNEAAHVGAVLHGIVSDWESCDGILVVVADGGSTDETRSVVAAFAAQNANVRLIDNPARIQSAAINLAARLFGTGVDVLIRCDAHAIYPAKFCRNLIETLNRTDADSVVVPLDSLGEGCVQRAIAWVSNSFLGTGGAAHRAGRRSGFVDHGHHAAFRMESFRLNGGYDESLAHNEDAEFDCRQRANGGRIYLDCELRVGYVPRSTFAALGRQYFRYGMGRSRTVRKHRNSLRLRQLAVPAHLVLSTAALAAAAWVPWLLLWPALYVSTTSAVAIAIACRERACCGLLVAPAAFAMHTAWGAGFLWGWLQHRDRPWRGETTPPLWRDAGDRP